MTLPGLGYIVKMVSEYIHGNCINKQNELCKDRCRNGWNIPSIHGPIPRQFQTKRVFLVSTIKLFPIYQSKTEDGKPRKK